jgi:hypothetical protein
MAGTTRTRAFIATVAATLSFALMVGAPPSASAARSEPKGFPPLVAVTGARAATTAICSPGVCFYYVGARQTGLSANGSSVALTQAEPIVGANDFHSLAELAVESADQQEIVEVGWTVDENLNGDSVPHLFVYHWIDGVSTCYNACGFVASARGPQAGDPVTVGSVGRFKIQFEKDRWVVSYNGNNVGYFPESLWGGSFTKAGLVQAFGEVAAGEATSPQTQMGNGTLGSMPKSAAIKNFALLGSARASLSYYVYGGEAGYDYGKLTRAGMRFGGPGGA